MMIQSVTKAGKKLFVILILGITLLQSGCNKATKETQQKAEKADGVEEKKKTESGDWEEARTTPYGKYPETVTYTLAQMNGANNSNLPQGQTYENNEYTRYLKKMLNIQNENTYMESEDRYDEFVNVIVKDRMLPAWIPAIPTPTLPSGRRRPRIWLAVSSRTSRSTRVTSMARLWFLPAPSCKL